MATRKNAMAMKRAILQWPRDARLGATIYSALFHHLKCTGEKHDDVKVLDALHTISDAKLLQLLRGE